MYGGPEYIDIITWLTQKMWDVIFHDSESQRELTPSPLEHTLDIDICKYKIPLERFCHQCQKAQFQLVLTQRHSDWWVITIIQKKYIYFKNTCISELEKAIGVIVFDCLYWRYVAVNKHDWWWYTRNHCECIINLSHDFSKVSFNISSWCHQFVEKRGTCDLDTLWNIS